MKKLVVSLMMMLSSLCWFTAALVFTILAFQCISNSQGFEIFGFAMFSTAVAISFAHFVGFASAAFVSFLVGVGLFAHGFVPPEDKVQTLR